MRTRVLLAAALLLLTTGCQPIENPSPNEKPQPGEEPRSAPTMVFNPDIDPDYTLLVSTYYNPPGTGLPTPVRRSVSCTISGVGRAGTPVMVTDETTGITLPYTIVVAERRTPLKIPIKDYANLYGITFFCTAYNLRSRDSLFCEVAVGGEFGPEAPLKRGGEVIVNRPHSEAGWPGLSAACGGTIDPLR